MSAPARVFSDPGTDAWEPDWKRAHRWLSRHCPACGAEPGEKCDGSRIPRYEDFHFARREAA
jgi:hypothetical protein